MNWIMAFREFISIFYIVVDEWESWIPWYDCSSTCGGGTRHRTRQCHDEPPTNGAECEGSPYETEQCNTEKCTNSEWNNFQLLILTMVEMVTLLLFCYSTMAWHYQNYAGHLEFRLILLKIGKHDQVVSAEVHFDHNCKLEPRPN
jgi:hypothetical protein